MLKIRNEKILHALYLIGIVIKSMDGILELLGGFILFAIKSDSMVKIVQTIFRHELIQDPTDILANYLIKASHTVSFSTLSFAAVYLMIHGFIKIGLVTGLWFKKLWAYPLAEIALAIFVIYQLIRFSRTHSLILILLTVLDIVILLLVNIEYKRVKKSHKHRNMD